MMIDKHFEASNELSVLCFSGNDTKQSQGFLFLQSKKKTILKCTAMILFKASLSVKSSTVNDRAFLLSIKIFIMITFTEPVPSKKRRIRKCPSCLGLCDQERRNNRYLVKNLCAWLVIGGRLY